MNHYADMTMLTDTVKREVLVSRDPGRVTMSALVRTGCERVMGSDFVPGHIGQAIRELAPIMGRPGDNFQAGADDALTLAGTPVHLERPVDQPVRRHKRKRWDRHGKYNARIQKKWTKRFGTHPVEWIFVAKQQGWSKAPREPRYSIHLSPMVLHDLRVILDHVLEL
jgi:hypothetical protein